MDCGLAFRIIGHFVNPETSVFMNAISISRLIDPFENTSPCNQTVVSEGPVVSFDGGDFS